MSNIKKIMLYVLVILLMAESTLQGQAMISKKEQKPAEKLPIVIDADELYFSDLTGDMFAKGNVVVTQSQSKVMGDLMRGNAKQNEIWIDDSAVFTEPGAKLSGSSIRYNYKNREGTMAKAGGRVGKELVDGGNVEMKPDEYIIHNGTITRCPAKVPDYHVSADKVEIWPGERIIAYNAKFWIKDKVIYSMARYQKSLRNDEQSEFPQLGYTSDDGAFIIQHLEYPFDHKLSAHVNAAWYSKAGWRPSFGLNDYEDGFKLSAVYGHFRDSNSNWIKKEPELKLETGRRLGNLPVLYSFSVTQGEWVDSTKKSWHQDYNLYFSREPIVFSNFLRVEMGAGVERIYESYDHSRQNIFKYDVTLVENWSPKLTSYVGYHYTRNNNTLFAYGRSDLAKSLDSGFTYKIDKMNAIGFAQSYDMTNHKIFDQDYYWHRNLHCWELSIGYRARRDQVVVEFSTKRF